MKVELFGLAKVFVEEDRDFGKPPKVEINWSCIGSVSIDRAREFIADMEKAVAFAVAEEERLGLREGKHGA